MTFLSNHFESVAVEERDSLFNSQKSVLETFGEQVWDHGVLFAVLEHLRVLFENKILSRADVQVHVGVGKSALCKWFSDGHISAPRFQKLLEIPEVAQYQPSANEIRFHEHREATTWVYQKVVGSPCKKKYIDWAEFSFIREVHLSEEDDVRKQFEMCPSDLKQMFPLWTAGNLLDAMDQWGKSYRLFCLENSRDGN